MCTRGTETEIADPTVELWITEGIKKGDSLTSRGICAVSITGVFNWRSPTRHPGRLGGCATQRPDRNHLLRRRRLDQPERAPGHAAAGPMVEVQEREEGLVPDRPGRGQRQAGQGCGRLLRRWRDTRGVEVRQESTESRTRISPTTPSPTPGWPRPSPTTCWPIGSCGCLGSAGWRWDGRRWAGATDVEVTEAVRTYALHRFAEVVEAHRDGQATKQTVDGWRSMLSAGRERAVLALARGIAGRKIEELDADPDLINTPAGVVDLRTGELSPHDPALAMTKITSGSYRPGFAHPDWSKALEALPEPEREWLRARIGQGITGHTTPDGIMPVLQGTGENGKSSVTTDGLVPALGDYASMASPKLFQASKGTEHSTERAELRGKRLLIAEELTEGRSIDVTALKQIQDVGVITARYVCQDNFTFRTSHSLFTTTNYVPVVSETDHGTWRRLALLRFPYTFRKPGEPLTGDNDRAGRPGLKARIKANADGQHDAIVTWAVEGAVQVVRRPGNGTGEDGEGRGRHAGMEGRG